MNNSLRFINESSTTSIYGFMNDFDNITRVLLLVSHILYFIIVFLFKEFQKISYFHMTHTNLIGVLTGIHYCIWINKVLPTFEDQNLNDVLCSISEACWAIFKYARAYSILILAAYRYLAVFKSQLYNQICKSVKFTLISSGLIWLISAVIFLIAKYSGQSLSGLIICYDGYSKTQNDTIIYYVITSVFGFILPIVLVCLVYFLIQTKLNKLSKSFVNNKTGDKKSKKKTKVNHKKENKLALQFILFNLFEILSSLFLMLLTICNLIPNFNVNYYYFRQLCRILNNVSQSFIPIISVLFHYSTIKVKNMIFFNSLNSLT